MEALINNRGMLARAFNLASGKTAGQGCQVGVIAVPTISDKEILVKVHTVAFNPIDFKYVDLLASPGSIIGCDYAGEVAEVGKNALGGWKVGDRVAGFVHGGNYNDRGSFAQYLKVDGDLAWRIPDQLSNEEAASYGLVASTAYIALSSRLDVPLLESKLPQNRGSILVYAGSTSVGLFAIQFAKKAGYTVVTTASPRSFDLVRRYGADSYFDYRSRTAAQEIAAAFPGITRALDCISEGPSTEFCAQVMKSKGGKVVTLSDQKKVKVPGVESELLIVFTAFGQEFAMLPPLGPTYPASSSDREALVRFFASLPQLVENLKPPPIRNLGTGFDKILLGLSELRNGKVSGQKLVANV